MSSTRQTRNIRRQQGQSMVEFGMVIGFLVIMIVSGVDVGLVAHNIIALQDAASRGAQIAAFGANDTEIKDTVYKYLQKTYFENVFLMGTLGNPAIEIFPSQENRTIDTPVSVKINYRLGFVVGPTAYSFILMNWPVTHKTTKETAYLEGEKPVLPPYSIPFTEDFEEGLGHWVIAGGGVKGLGSELDYLCYPGATKKPSNGKDHVFFGGTSFANNGVMYTTVSTNGNKNLTITFDVATAGNGLADAYDNVENQWLTYKWNSVNTKNNSLEAKVVTYKKDSLYLEYSVDGGTNWTTCWYQDGDPEPWEDLLNASDIYDNISGYNALVASGPRPYHSNSVDITLPDALNNMMMRFRYEIKGMDGMEFFYLDKLAVSPK